MTEQGEKYFQMADVTKNQLAFHPTHLFKQKKPKRDLSIQPSLKINKTKLNADLPMNEGEYTYSQPKKKLVVEQKLIERKDLKR